MLMEKHRVRGLENKVLRDVLAPKSDDVTDGVKGCSRITKTKITN
jgi:hypothetical protein